MLPHTHRPLHSNVLSRVEKETERTWGTSSLYFCKWDSIAKIVTDNGPGFVTTMGYLPENMFATSRFLPTILDQIIEWLSQVEAL